MICGARVLDDTAALDVGHPVGSAPAPARTSRPEGQVARQTGDGDLDDQADLVDLRVPILLLVALERAADERHVGQWGVPRIQRDRVLGPDQPVAAAGGASNLSAILTEVVAWAGVLAIFSYSLPPQRNTRRSGGKTPASIIWKNIALVTSSGWTSGVTSVVMRGLR